MNGASPFMGYLWSNSITTISQNIKICIDQICGLEGDSSDVLGLSQNENETGS